MERREPKINTFDCDEMPSPTVLHREVLHTHKSDESASQIALAIIAAAFIGVGGWIGYIEYKAYQVDRALVRAVAAERAAAAEREAEHRRRMEQQRVQQDVERRRRAEVAARDALAIENARKQNSSECRFWKLQHETAPTDRTAKEVAKLCPLG